MSQHESVADVLVVGIRVYWRTHDEMGRLPRHEQEWFFELDDDCGGQRSWPLGDWIGPDVSSITEAVVSIADQFGLTICVDQVRTDTRRMTASWYAGIE